MKERYVYPHPQKGCFVFLCFAGLALLVVYCTLVYPRNVTPSAKINKDHYYGTGVQKENVVIRVLANNSTPVPVPKKHIVDNNSTQVPKKHIVDNNSSPVPKKHIVDNNSTQVPKKHIVDNNSTPVPNKPIINNNGTGVQKKHLIVELFPNWTTKDPHDKVFTRRLFIYSAVVAVHPKTPSANQTEIHFPVFQSGQTVLKLACCLLPSPDSSSADSQEDPKMRRRRTTAHLTTEAVLDTWNFRDMPRKSLDPGSPLKKSTFAMVYRCRFPIHRQELKGSYATLTSPQDGCPADQGQFLPVYYPEVKPGGLAISAKVAFGANLDANKLVEWFEMQRLLGVDKIVIYDLGNTELVYKTFRYYQDTGLLDLIPYNLPGPPWGRTMSNFSKTNAKLQDDKVVEIWDSRLRLAGYDYVQGIDMDEIILPRRFTALKPFFKEQFAKQPTAASLHFKVQGFILSWEPVEPKAPLYLLRYMRSTEESSSERKYVYRPERTHQVLTHLTFPYPSYTKYERVPDSDAAIFHYRDTCKANWNFNCEKTTRVDRDMERFQKDLVPAVMTVRRKLGLPDLS